MDALSQPEDLKAFYSSRLPSVLTSDVHNEAELIFSILEDKDRHTVSYLDVLTLLRGMGMDPVGQDMDYLREIMAEPIEKLDAAYREEQARKEKERKEEERKKGKKSVFIKKDKKGGKSVDPNSKEGKKGEKKLSDPPEEIKNIDWNIFISAVETMFRDNYQEQQYVLEALCVFDPDGKGKMTRDKLIELVTTNGESVLAPIEVKHICELLPEEFELVEFAQRVQGTYIPPTPEEIAAKEDAERKVREEKLARERAAAAASLDPLNALLSGGGGGNPAEGGETAEV